MKIMAMAFGLAFGLAGCVTSGGKVSVDLTQVTTNLAVALQSAQVLVQQAQSTPGLQSNSKVQAKVQQISQVLASGSANISTVNTLAAALLNLAGSAGFALAGA